MRIFRNFHPKNRVSRPRFSAEHDAAIENLRKVKGKPENWIFAKKPNSAKTATLATIFGKKNRSTNWGPVDFEMTR